MPPTDSRSVGRHISYEPGGNRRSAIFKAMRKDNPPPTNIEKVVDIRGEVAVHVKLDKR